MEAPCFFIGLGAGVALGMLLAPRSGQENRRRLREIAQEGKDVAKNGLEQGQNFIKRQGTELLQAADEKIDRTSSAFSQQKNKLANAVKAGTEAYSKTVGSR